MSAQDGPHSTRGKLNCPSDDHIEDAPQICQWTSTSLETLSISTLTATKRKNATTTTTTPIEPATGLNLGSNSNPDSNLEVREALSPPNTAIQGRMTSPTRQIQTQTQTQTPRSSESSGWVYGRRWFRGAGGYQDREAADKIGGQGGRIYKAYRTTIQVQSPLRLSSTPNQNQNQDQKDNMNGNRQDNTKPIAAPRRPGLPNRAYGWPYNGNMNNDEESGWADDDISPCNSLGSSICRPVSPLSIHSASMARPSSSVSTRQRGSSTQLRAQAAFAATAERNIRQDDDEAQNQTHYDNNRDLYNAASISQIFQHPCLDSAEGEWHTRSTILDNQLPWYGVRSSTTPSLSQAEQNQQRHQQIHHDVVAQDAASKPRERTGIGLESQEAAPAEDANATPRPRPFHETQSLQAWSYPDIPDGGVIEAGYALYHEYRDNRSSPMPTQFQGQFELQPRRSIPPYAESCQRPRRDHLRPPLPLSQRPPYYDGGRNVPTMPVRPPQPPQRHSGRQNFRSTGEQDTTTLATTEARARATTIPLGASSATGLGPGPRRPETIERRSRLPPNPSNTPDPTSGHSDRYSAADWGIISNSNSAPDN